MKFPIQVTTGDPLRPLGDTEAVRIIVTPLGKRVIKQSALAGMIIGTVSALVINRRNPDNSAAQRRANIAKDAMKGEGKT